MPHPQAEVNRGPESGLCLLSIDAGGTRGISQLKILVELMHRLNAKDNDLNVGHPCAAFDLIGGVGTGGFISILLVVFGMTAEEALQEFIKFSREVLELNVDAGKRTSRLKEYVNELLLAHEINQNLGMLDANVRSKDCKIVIPISYKHAAGSHCIIRNFSGNQGSDLKFTVTEAILATVATPPLFHSTSISKDSATFEYIGGDLTLSNPIREVISEAHEWLGPERRVACLLSLGCGHPGVFSVPEDPSLATWNTFLSQLAIRSDTEASRVDFQMENLGIYHRFSVSQGLQQNSTTSPSHHRNGLVYGSLRHSTCQGLLLWLVRQILVYITIRLMRIHYRISISDTSRDTSSESGRIITHTEVYLAHASLSRQIEACVGSIRGREGIPSLYQLRYCGGQTILPQVLPSPVRTFVMREGPWAFIERIVLGTEVDGQKMLAITGGGGYGKSEIVRKFVQVHQRSFASVFFIDGSSEDRIRSDIVQSVRSLGNDHNQKHFDDCLTYLAQHSDRPRLIVYDNIDPGLDISLLLPQGHSCVIIMTSRNQSIGGLCPGAHLTLGVMTLGEAVELLRGSRLPHQLAHQSCQEEMASIAHTLGYHPFALRHACNYMYDNLCSPGQYLIRLKQCRDEILSKSSRTPQSPSNLSVFAALDASFNRVSTHRKLCLQLLSCFHWERFPLELIKLAAEEEFTFYEHGYFEPGEGVETSKALLKDIFYLEGRWRITNVDEITLSLRNHSLITLVSAGDTCLLQMHPLLHERIHSSIPEEDLPKFFSAAALLLSSGARKTTTPAGQYLASHVNHLLSLWKPRALNDYWAFSFILSDANQHKLALRMQQKVTQKLIETLDGHDPMLHGSLESLADTYRVLQLFEPASVAEETVLELRKAAFGIHNERTLRSYDRLAITYRNRGLLPKARKLQEEALTIRTETLGWEHAATVSACSELAITLRELGYFSDAETMQQSVLSSRSNIFGLDHPETLLSCASLALTCRDLGRFQEVQILRDRVLKSRMESLGRDDPATMLARFDVSLAYRDLDRLEEALEMQEEVLRWYRKARGEGHRETLSAYRELGRTYCAMERYSEAEALQTEGMVLARRIFGESHSTAIEAMDSLVPIQSEALEFRKLKYGDQHLETIFASTNLALRYCEMGRLHEAEALQVAALKSLRKTLWEGHPDIFAAQCDLGFTYCMMQRFSEAEDVLADGMKWTRLIFGYGHPETISAMRNLVPIQVKVVDSMRDVLGKIHPDTTRASSNLALMYRELGQLGEAEALQDVVRTLRIETLGRDHPDTLLASSNLALIYRDMGRQHEAELLLAEVSQVVAPGRSPETGGFLDF